MEVSLEQEVLHWQDLTADEVYHVAHLENEARDAMAVKLASVAFSSDASVTLKKANDLISHHDKRAEAWLEDQALIRVMGT